MRTPSGQKSCHRSRLLVKRPLSEEIFWQAAWSEDFCNALISHECQRNRLLKPTTEAGGPRGYDAAKKVTSRKRHALVDADGRALKLLVHPASVQDRDAAIPLLTSSRNWYPFIERVFADSVYAGERLTEATCIVVQIIRRLADQVGLTALPRRWVVERFLAWINRNRRLAKDFAGTIASATASLYAAAAMLLTRKLARSQ